ARRNAGLGVVALLLLLLPATLTAAVTINGDQPLFTNAIPFTIAGTSDAPSGTVVTVSVEPRVGRVETQVIAGAWSIDWATPLPTGTYTIDAVIGADAARQILRVQLPANVQRQWPVEPRVVYGTPEVELPVSFLEMTDRWRIMPPPYELDEHSRGRFDPYNQNVLKGDFPIPDRRWGRKDLFFVFTGISDTLAESRTTPTPSGVSTVRPGSIRFFGNDQQNVFNQNIGLSFDLFEGDTAFTPIRQRLKATVVANLNYVHARENAIVKPDVRRGTKRTDAQLALQEIFYERKLRDLSPNFDFVSLRAGSQPFSSDFRGFIFSDTNAGVRLFGNYASNRFQYNLALFDQREKDTNSGLNTLTERRGQQVAIANVYWQDFLHPGFTEEFSIHQLHDKGSFHYDRNGILVRPAPVGVFTPHTIDATYLGAAGLGHIGRINIDHALYVVFGRDSLNPITGPDPKLKGRDAVHIGAAMAALELSYDRDWLRPRLAFFYATGDRNPRDRNARGFDSIFDGTAFAGGGFSFFNRLGIKLAGSGVSLVERGSLLPDLRSSKDEGQPNYVNPGLQLVSAGLDADITPRLKAVITANYIRLDTTKPLEAVLFQGHIRPELGEDLSIGIRYRPFLSNNMVIVGGAAAFIPGAGFKDIYENTGTLYHVFTNVVLTF
ncbi:MAG: hypothetical protein JWO56_1123, partial [Acidobacteria bacterium]|nr:hypothetical protein [Acidobacteriota bacterium]